jgi:hypothetical protein
LRKQNRAVFVEMDENALTPRKRGRPFGSGNFGNFPMTQALAVRLSVFSFKTKMLQVNLNQ